MIPLTLTALLAHYRDVEDMRSQNERQNLLEHGHRPVDFRSLETPSIAMLTRFFLLLRTTSQNSTRTRKKGALAPSARLS